MQPPQREVSPEILQFNGILPADLSGTVPNVFPPAVNVSARVTAYLDASSTTIPVTAASLPLHLLDVESPLPAHNAHNVGLSSHYVHPTDEEAAPIAQREMGYVSRSIDGVAQIGDSTRCCVSKSSQIRLVIFIP